MSIHKFQLSTLNNPGRIFFPVHIQLTPSSIKLNSKPYSRWTIYVYAIILPPFYLISTISDQFIAYMYIVLANRNYPNKTWSNQNSLKSINVVLSWVVLTVYTTKLHCERGIFYTNHPNYVPKYKKKLVCAPHILPPIFGWTYSEKSFIGKRRFVYYGVYFDN